MNLSIYQQHTKVYLSFFLLFLLGIISYYLMPVALYPNSTRPEIISIIQYGDLTKEHFLHSYGKHIESSLLGIDESDSHAELVRAKYKDTFVNIRTKFAWNDDAKKCMKEVTNQIAHFRPNWSEVAKAIALAIVLIGTVLLLRFQDLGLVLIIMLAIPFGIFGAILSLYIFSSTISLNSGLGIVLLIGISVANSILLLEKLLSLNASGIPLIEAIHQTCISRIRPILMTSLTTILGMLPVAVGLGDGGKVLQPLGISVSGGLLTSLILTIYVIPSLAYLYIQHKPEKFEQ